MFFGPKLPVDQAEFEWLHECFGWLHSQQGARDAAAGFRPQLVTPDDPEFAAASTAAELFEAVKKHAGMQEWECELVQGEAGPETLERNPFTGTYSNEHALGTFQVSGNTPVIHYHPALLKNPAALIATFAHELAHLLLATHELPPGGAELEEHATDCAAVYMGFGIFLANNARNFAQFQDAGMMGWSAQSSGYLSENALVTLLAMFHRLFPSDADPRPYLKKYLQSDYGKASKYLDRKHPDFADQLTKRNR